MNSGIEPAIGMPSISADDEIERKADRDGDHQAVRPDLGHRDLERRQRHDQQMVHGAVLALPDDGGSGENDRQHGDIVDDRPSRW